MRMTGSTHGRHLGAPVCPFAGFRFFHFGR